MSCLYTYIFCIFNIYIYIIFINTHRISKKTHIYIYIYVHIYTHVCLILLYSLTTTSCPPKCKNVVFFKSTGDHHDRDLWTRLCGSQRSCKAAAPWMVHLRWILLYLPVSMVNTTPTCIYIYILYILFLVYVYTCVYICIYILLHIGILVDQ